MLWLQLVAAGFVVYAGAGVVKIAGLQQGCTGEVLLISSGPVVMVVQVQRDDFFSLSLGCLALGSAGSVLLILGSLASRTQSLSGVKAGSWLVGSLIGRH